MDNDALKSLLKYKQHFETDQSGQRLRIKTTDPMRSSLLVLLGFLGFGMMMGVVGRFVDPTLGINVGDGLMALFALVFVLVAVFLAYYRSRFEIDLSNLEQSRIEWVQELDGKSVRTSKCRVDEIQHLVCHTVAMFQKLQFQVLAVKNDSTRVVLLDGYYTAKEPELHQLLTAELSRLLGVPVKSE